MSIFATLLKERASMTAEAIKKNAQGVFPEEGVWRAKRAWTLTI